MIGAIIVAIIASLCSLTAVNGLTQLHRTQTNILTDAGFGNDAGINALSNGDFILAGSSNGKDGGGAARNFFLARFAVQEGGSGNTSLWHIEFGTEGTDVALASTIDANDNIYSVGACRGTVGSIPSAGNADACLFKHDSNGNQLCATQIGGSGPENFYGVLANTTSVSVVGATSSPTFDSHTLTGLRDGFFMSYDASSCTKQSHVQITSPVNGSAIWYDLARTSDGDYWIVGTFDAQNYDMGGGFVLNSTNYDGLLLKMRPDGLVLFATHLQGDKVDHLHSVVLDSHDNVYAVGFSDSSMIDGIANAGQFNDWLVVKYDANGAKQWTVYGTGELDDKAFGAAVDEARNVLYVSGDTGSTTFLGQPTEVGKHYGEAVLGAFDLTTGAVVGEEELHSDDDYGYYNAGRTVTLKNHAVYVSGSTTGPMGGVFGGAHGYYGNTLKASFGVVLQEESPAPSRSPSTAPSRAPTTASPTVSPTFSPADRPLLRVTQSLAGVAAADYFSQQAAFNRTLQQTIGEIVGLLSPDQVTSITVTLDTSSRRHLQSTAASSFTLVYLLSVHTASLTVPVVQHALSSAATAGTMATLLQTYAGQNGVHQVGNASFGTPQVVTADGDTSTGRSASSQLTGVEIAGLVIGILLGVILITLMTLFILTGNQSKVDSGCVVVKKQKQVGESGEEGEKEDKGESQQRQYQYQQVPPTVAAPSTYEGVV